MATFAHRLLLLIKEPIGKSRVEVRLVNLLPWVCSLVWAIICTTAELHGQAHPWDQFSGTAERSYIVIHPLGMIERGVGNNRRPIVYFDQREQFEAFRRHFAFDNQVTPPLKANLYPEYTISVCERGRVVFRIWVYEKMSMVEVNRRYYEFDGSLPLSGYKLGGYLSNGCTSIEEARAICAARASDPEVLFVNPSYWEQYDGSLLVYLKTNDGSEENAILKAKEALDATYPSDSFDLRIAREMPEGYELELFCSEAIAKKFDLWPVTKGYQKLGYDIVECLTK